MKWQPTEFRQRRPDVREVSAAKHTIRSEINPSYRRRGQICSRSFTPTGTVLLTICADSTIWRSISVDSRGPSSQNEHGPKFEVKVKERSLPKNMKQSSPRKKMRSAAPTMNCFTRPVPPKPMQRISQQKTLIGKTAFLFIAAKNSDRSPSRVD